MKIWYQSITDLREVPLYHQALRGVLAELTPDQCEVRIIGLREGTFGGLPPVRALRDPQCYDDVASQVAENAATAQREGFGALVIGSFVAPGLLNARSKLDIPILSMAELVVLSARQMGKSTRLVSINSDQMGMTSSLLAELGLADGAVRTTRLDLADERDISNAIRDPEPLCAAFVDACQDDDLEQVIVPAEGILALVVRSAQLRAIRGRPVLDVFAISLSAAFAAARIPFSPSTSETIRSNT
ncbi:MAG: hypothetical protein QOK08_2549 [Actinomycetota bacterium]|jgi:Asp/Glu/hydantoin racemase|nr:hypothetical protein [Glaciihabitans sp.]MDQ1544911.1 hypothetical protein [Actinomycetota bacterium]